MNGHLRYGFIHSQATITDIYTPTGDCIHRIYKLELEEWDADNLHYTSKSMSLLNESPYDYWLRS